MRNCGPNYSAEELRALASIYAARACGDTPRELQAGVDAFCVVYGRKHRAAHAIACRLRVGVRPQPPHGAAS